MVYGAIYSAQENLPAVDVRLTYYQIDTDRILRFVRHFSRQELEQFLHKLLHRYLPWAQRQLAWQETRSGSLTAMRFPFEAYRPGQRALHPAQRYGEQKRTSPPAYTSKPGFPFRGTVPG